MVDSLLDTEIYDTAGACGVVNFSIKYNEPTLSKNARRSQGSICEILPARVGKLEVL